MRGRGEARCRQRSRQEIAVVDREPDLAAVADIEIGMAGEKRLRLGGRRIAKTVDIMMAVALGMGDADQRAEREILLHRQSRLAGQVLAGDETLLAASAPLGRAGCVDDRLVDALAGFRGNAAIAERPRHRERVIGIVGLVDDEVAPRQRAERRLARDVARHRLLDIEELLRDRPQRSVALEPIDQRAQRSKIGILFVGVERDAVVMGQRGELPADAGQAIRVMRGSPLSLSLK